MSNHILSTDHSATMKTSHGITLNTSQSFVPYNISIKPSYKFEISDEIGTATYTGRLMDTFAVTNGAALNTIGNEGTITGIFNLSTTHYIENSGTIDELNNKDGGTIGTITDIPRETTITNVSGKITIPVKSNLTGSIVFGGDNGTSDVTLKYDSAKGCMVFLYE